MRTVASILFGAALALSQVLAPLTTSASAPPARCTHCACGGAGCCVTDSAPAPAPAPAPPALPTGPGTDAAWLFQPSIAFRLALVADPAILPSRPSAITVRRLPLRVRDCAFLI